MRFLTLKQMKSAIPALEEADKAFSGTVARDQIMSAQTNMFFQMGLQNPDVAKAGMAMHAQILRGFKSNMVSVVSGYQAGSINFPQALKKWQTFAKEHYTNMFIAGTKAAGNPYYSKLGLTQKDLAFIDKAVKYESRFFKRLLFDMKDPKHVPLSQIPRDSAGRLAKGYRVKKFGYLKRVGKTLSRAEMYAESGSAQFYNGMVAGSSQHLNVHWVLGIPMLDHCSDCPRLSRRIWTWKTLPTVPRAGDTECKYMCYCHLEFRPKKTGPKINIPGRATAEAISTVGRNARVFDTQGVEMTGVLQQEVEALYAKMYKARQMMSVTTGAERMEWVHLRKNLNRQLIDRLKAGDYRATPTIAVKDLVSTIETARDYATMTAGTTIGAEMRLVPKLSDLFTGDEIIFTRADFSARGVVQLINNRLHVKYGNGETMLFNQDTDIVFLMKAAPRPTPGGLKTSGKVNFQKNITLADAEMLELWAGSSGYVEVRAYLSLSAANRRLYETTRGIFMNLDFEARQHFVNAADMLTRMFAKYKNGVSMETLYRGLSDIKSAPYNAMKSWKPGQVVKVERGVSSWTVNETVAENFSVSSRDARSVKFILQKGRAKTQELPIYDYSSYGDEMEVIVNTTNFRVVKIVEKEITRPGAPILDDPGKYKRLDIYLKEAD